MNEGMVPAKPFLTYEQQIAKLRDEKGLRIENVEAAVAMLKKHSYFDLISGYKRPFKQKDGNYKRYTSIEDIYALYSFDNMLRGIVLGKILIIEKHIKSLLSYSFCEEYGSVQQAYLDATKYNYISKNQAGINKLVSKLTAIANDPKDYPYIKHQKEVYHNIPLWVMVKALTMGSISKMYSYLKPNIQSKISQEYEFVNEDGLARMLDLLSRFRNVCAHNERLFDYKYQRGAIKDAYVHETLHITRKKGKYTKGKSDLFAVLITLKYLLSQQEFDEFITQIREALNDLYSNTKQVNASQMRKYMGFPENWEAIRNCEKQEGGSNGGILYGTPHIAGGK